MEKVCLIIIYYGDFISIGISQIMVAITIEGMV